MHDRLPEAPSRRCGVEGLPDGVPPISDAEFSAYQALVQAEAGIFLSEAKRALLVGRLARRLRELGLRSYGAYLQLVREDEAERVRMIDAVSTNETHFFREPRQFEFLETQLLPAWIHAAEAGRARAACACGVPPARPARSPTASP